MSPPATTRVAYLGPAGTYAEEALRASAPGSVEEIPFPTVYETVMAVQAGGAERAVVPIENSLEGGVGATLDALAGEADRVRITADVVHPINHCLIARRALELDQVKRVVSHPQATAQSARFLRERVPGADQVGAPSTAEAVQQVAAAEEPWAAVGSRLAAELYGCEVLAAGIQDHPDNVTRFVWLGAEEIAAAGAGAALKTSLVFWGFNDDSPGALVDVLREFADRGVNLTRIESRPRPEAFGHYRFFADLGGGEQDEAVREALAALEQRVETLRILGSYPTLESGGGAGAGGHRS
ncbi:MAG: prephenate dehydratase [Thermoleophilaceae bacterium]